MKEQRKQKIRELIYRFVYDLAQSIVLESVIILIKYLYILIIHYFNL